MTPPDAIMLTVEQCAALRQAAERAYPRECCGLLIGAGENPLMVCEIVPAANIAADPARRFEIDPQLQFDLLRRLRGTDTRILGHYHSHPNGVAELSAHDRAMAYDPAAAWIIIPVAGQHASQPRAFRCLSPARAEPIRIILAGTPQ